MADRWRIIVVTSDKATWQALSQTLYELGLESSWSSSVEECMHIFRRDLVNMVFCDERVSDGDYRDICAAVTGGLIEKPKVVLMSELMDIAECEQAKTCGIFAVIESPCRPVSVEWTVILAKRAAREPSKATPAATVPKFDIFFGVPDRDAVWVCAVRGLADAKERMDRLATERPGRYFIFHTPERKILAQVETFAKPAQILKPRAVQRPR